MNRSASGSHRSSKQGRGSLMNDVGTLFGNIDPQGLVSKKPTVNATGRTTANSKNAGKLPVETGKFTVPPHEDASLKRRLVKPKLNEEASSRSKEDKLEKKDKKDKKKEKKSKNDKEDRSNERSRSKEKKRKKDLAKGDSLPASPKKKELTAKASNMIEAFKSPKTVESRYNYSSSSKRSSKKNSADKNTMVPAKEKHKKIKPANEHTQDAGAEGQPPAKKRKKEKSKRQQLDEAQVETMLAIHRSADACVVRGTRIVTMTGDQTKYLNSLKVSMTEIKDFLFAQMKECGDDGVAKAGLVERMDEFNSKEANFKSVVDGYQVSTDFIEREATKIHEEAMEIKQRTEADLKERKQILARLHKKTIREVRLALMVIQTKENKNTCKNRMDAHFQIFADTVVFSINPFSDVFGKQSIHCLKCNTAFHARKRGDPLPDYQLQLSGLFIQGENNNYKSVKEVYIAALMKHHNCSEGSAKEIFEKMRFPMYLPHQMKDGVLLQTVKHTCRPEPTKNTVAKSVPPAKGANNSQEEVPKSDSEEEATSKLQVSFKPQTRAVTDPAAAKQRADQLAEEKKKARFRLVGGPKKQTEKSAQSPQREQDDSGDKNDYFVLTQENFVEEAMLTSIKKPEYQDRNGDYMIPPEIKFIPFEWDQQTLKISAEVLDCFEMIGFSFNAPGKLDEFQNTCYLSGLTLKLKNPLRDKKDK